MTMSWLNKYSSNVLHKIIDCDNLNCVMSILNDNNIQYKHTVIQELKINVISFKINNKIYVTDVDNINVQEIDDYIQLVNVDSETQHKKSSSTNSKKQITSYSQETNKKPKNYLLKAYDIGKQAKEKYSSERSFFQDMSYDELNQLSLDDAAWDAFFKAGFYNKDMPEYKTGWRYGDIPERGKSYNFRDQQFESGVSVMFLDGESPSSGAKLYEIFNKNNRKLQHVGGWYVGKGSDGEPILVDAQLI